jgi:hypothetical protein
MMQLTLNQTHVKFAATQKFHLFQNWELISNYCVSDGGGTAGCVLMQQAVK